MTETIKIGISACLLGWPVRYDGTGKGQPHIVDYFANKAELIPVCPETSCGLGVPRETIRLTGNPFAPNLETINTKQELTAKMLTWIESTLIQLIALHDIKGFILKSRSPSCGYKDAPVWQPNGKYIIGQGLFALAISLNLPHIICADESMLATEIELADFWRKIQV